MQELYLANLEFQQRMTNPPVTDVGPPTIRLPEAVEAALAVAMVESTLEVEFSFEGHVAASGGMNARAGEQDDARSVPLGTGASPSRWVLRGRW